MTWDCDQAEEKTSELLVDLATNSGRNRGQNTVSLVGSRKPWSVPNCSRARPPDGLAAVGWTEFSRREGSYGYRFSAMRDHAGRLAGQQRAITFFQEMRQSESEMAKCPICNSRKGKRKCLVADALICTQCCGETRTEEACSGCIFYQKPKRKYEEVPAYSPAEMERDMELETYGNAIEGALCAYDVENNNRLSDKDAIRILELLIDKYHFKDQKTDDEREIVKNGVAYVDGAIESDLNKVSDEEVVKLLGVIRFVAKRRTKIGREYMNLIHQYVGRRVGTGIRLMQG